MKQTISHSRIIKAIFKEKHVIFWQSDNIFFVFSMTVSEQLIKLFNEHKKWDD